MKDLWCWDARGHIVVFLQRGDKLWVYHWTHSTYRTSEARFDCLVITALIVGSGLHSVYLRVLLSDSTWKIFVVSLLTFSDLKRLCLWNLVPKVSAGYNFTSHCSFCFLFWQAEVVARRWFRENHCCYGFIFEGVRAQSTCNCSVLLLQSVWRLWLQNRASFWIKSRLEFVVRRG